MKSNRVYRPLLGLSVLFAALWACEPEEKRASQGDVDAQADGAIEPDGAEGVDAVAPDSEVDPCQGLVVRHLCLDGDGDGHGDPENAVETCEVMPDRVELCDDCDDRSAAAKPGASELCNGADDDCDGTTDEGLGLGQVCSIGVGICAREGQTACRPDGQVGCSGQPGVPGAETCNGEDDDCNGVVDDSGLAERCNDQDDDCDGQIDEGLGKGDACTQGVGRCREAGVRTCAADGRVACNASAGTPAAETCDGTDEDCNGLVDDTAEGCDCELGNRVACGSDVGVCERGLQTCVGGRLGPCEGQVGPGNEACNGQDDDCDGTDDNRPGAVCTCLDGVEQACGSEVGECQAGRQRCVDGAFSACSGVAPAPEVCNGLDDDCNGVDDDRGGEACECVDGMMRACGNSVGICSEGQQACEGGRWGACVGGVAPVTEVCDGLDNDCNGRLDDGLPGVGEACTAGVGACERAGHTACIVESQAVGCDARAGDPVAEVCDGIDNDCNGTIDDLADPGCGCENGFVVPCPWNVFALGVEVRAPGGAAQATYFQVVDRSMFDGRTVTNDRAREVQGIGRLFTLDEHVFIGERSTPTLHRYAVEPDLSLTETGALNFAAYGAPVIDIGHLIVGPNKWYELIGPTLTGVVFNPTTMAIDHDFPLADLQRPGYEGSALIQGTFLFEQKVYGNRGFVSTLHSVSAQNRYYPNMTVTVFDTDNDRVLKVIEDPRCYGPSTMVQDLNGDIYVSSYSYTGRVYGAAAVDAGVVQKPTCILRIRAGQDEFDPDYFVSFPDLLEGRECTRWYPVNARYSYAYAVTRAALRDAANPSNAVGEIWKIDLRTRTAARVMALGETTPFITLGYPDSHDSLVLGIAAVANDLSHTLVYRLVPSTDEITRIFEVNGLLRGFYPVR